MKKPLILLMLVAVLCGSCKTIILPGNNAKVPPGQMKKATGANSAKEYAPGQQKNKN